MQNKIPNIQSPEFWQQAWEHARKNLNAEKRKIRSEKEAMEFWSSYAPRYEKKYTPDETNDRVETVLEILRRKNFLTPETDILDIGSGPGTFALPLSRLCKNVTSLDGAEGMCRELQKKADADKISNINILHRLWEDVDIKEEGMAKQYDLVFASMTAAICDFDTLDKMNQASKKDCCLIFWAERSSSRARQDLWKVFFREEDSGYGGTSIIYPFNLLYSLGHTVY